MISGLWRKRALATQRVLEARLRIPVHSLYGDVRKPTAEMLSGLDAVLFDLQDVGVRVYTFIWTMTLAMEACRDAGVKFVVLDRPNPITVISMRRSDLKMTCLATRICGPMSDLARQTFGSILTNSAAVRTKQQTSHPLHDVAALTEIFRSYRPHHRASAAHSSLTSLQPASPRRWNAAASKASA